MSQDLVKALGVTPAEKKASELALEYICSDQVNVDDSFTDHKDSFIAGFKAALELAEVKVMEEALKMYGGLSTEKERIEWAHGKAIWTDKFGAYYELDEGLHARQTLSSWRSFRGEK